MFGGGNAGYGPTVGGCCPPIPIAFGGTVLDGGNGGYDAGMFVQADVGCCPVIPIAFGGAGFDGGNGGFEAGTNG